MESEEQVVASAAAAWFETKHLMMNIGPAASQNTKSAAQANEIVDGFLNQGWSIHTVQFERTSDTSFAVYYLFWRQV